METDKPNDENRQLPVVIHRVEHAVSLPVGIPATDASKARVELTQDQVDYLVNHMPGNWIPAVKKWWPILLMVLGFAGKVGAMIDKAMSTLPPDPPAVVKPLESPKAKAPDLQQLIDDAVSRSLKQNSKALPKAEPEVHAQPVPAPKEDWKFKD